MKIITRGKHLQLRELRACGNCGPQLRMNGELRERANRELREGVNCELRLRGHCGNKRRATAGTAGEHPREPRPQSREAAPQFVPAVARSLFLQ